MKRLLPALIIAFFIQSFSPVALAASPAAGASNRAPGFQALPRDAKLVLMPVDVELFLLTMGGVPEPRADWTESARKHMTATLHQSAKNFGVKLADVAEADADEWGEISALHAAVATAIANHHLGPLRLPTKNGQLDWTLSEAVSPIRARTQADYALFVWVRDSYASDQRKAAMLMMAMVGVAMVGGVQTGYASLVDLRSGQVVWFNRLFNVSGDLREPEPARKSVDELLQGFPGAR